MSVVEIEIKLDNIKADLFNVIYEIKKMNGVIRSSTLDLIDQINKLSVEV